MNNFLRLIFCAALALLAPPSLAALPQTIGYQGYLTTPGGAPVNGPLAMTFTLYNAASGGSALWIETQSAVNVANGNFNAVLGAVAPIPLPFDVPYWLGVTVNTDAEMSPRQALLASPYAFRAASLDGAANVQGTQVSGTISGATLPASNLTGIIATSNLAATQMLPAVACSPNQIPKWNGSVWACAADDNAGATGGAFGQVLTGTGGTPVWSGSPVLSNLTLASPSTASVGNIFKGNTRFIHNFGNSNTFIGLNAGNFTMTGSANTANGNSALQLNTTGSDNTASGMLALQLNTTGSDNTATGYQAMLSNTNGSYNTANGANALAVNVSGNSNTATGISALYSNSSGSNNTASGAGALQSNSTGYNNTADGLQALFHNTFGIENTASGISALSANLTGNNNAAAGAYSLFSNTSGSSNTASGYQTLYNSTGNNNTAIGFNAGYNQTTGSGNLYLGNEGVVAENNTIRIGSGGGIAGNHNRIFIAGIRGVATFVPNAISVVIDSQGQLGTSSSSRRFKDDIADMDTASNALMQLRPVTFHYKSDQNPAGRSLQYGLIAEEVADVYPGLVAYSTDGQIETVLYQFLPPMLLNEFQKQQRTIQALAAELALQRAQMQLLQNDLSAIKALLSIERPNSSGEAP